MKRAEAARRSTVTPSYGPLTYFVCALLCPLAHSAESSTYQSPVRKTWRGWCE